MSSTIKQKKKIKKQKKSKKDIIDNDNCKISFEYFNDSQDYASHFEDWEEKNIK